MRLSDTLSFHVSPARWKDRFSKYLLLAGVALLSACGDGDGEDDSQSDEVRPVVTLSVSQSVVQGGETVAIAASALDNLDGSLETKVTCTSGSLVGSLLVTDIMSTSTTINCSGTATDKAGNTGTGSIDITVQASVSKVELGSTDNIRPGQVALVAVTNLALDKVSYESAIGTAPVTLVRAAGDMLAFVVPDDLSPGPYRLPIMIGGRRYDLPLQVSAALVIPDPRATVLQTLREAQSVADSLLSDRSLNAGQQVQLIAARTSVTTAIAGIDSLTAVEMRRLAVAFSANPIFAPSDAVASAFTPVACGQALARSTGRLAVIAFVVGAGAIGGSAFPPLGPQVGVLAAAALLLYTGKGPALIRASIGDVKANCFTETEFEFDAVSSGLSSVRANELRALAVSERYGFKLKVPRSFIIHQTLGIEPSFVGRVERLRSLASQGLSLLPANFAVPLTSELETMSAPETRDVSAQEISLGAISRAGITGNKNGSGSTIVLTFDAGEDIKENVDFNFILNRVDTPPLTIAAQLVIDLPSAEDAAVDVTQGKQTISAVQIGGADTVEIVDPPTHGTATISASGSFSYTPVSSFFGEDRFTYRARNKSGASRLATVLLRVNRKFDGVWLIKTRSTTTSESRPGLCPTEAYSLTVNVVKASSTSYYVDLPPAGRLSLYMQNENDPAGLAGTLTATYDDDPGKTTETLNVRILDTSHLEGSSTFKYVGPNNTSCSGTASITGTRQ